MLFNFKTAVVKPGTKVTDESRPTLTLTPTFNSFRLNKLAQRLVQHYLVDSLNDPKIGTRVLMFDMAVQYPDIDPESRFALCEGYLDENGDPVGAKVADETGGFSYSVIYGAMLAQDNTIVNITPAALVDKGLVYPKQAGDKSPQHTSMKTFNTVLEPYANGEEFEVGNGVYRKLWLITNFIENDHTKREVGKSEPVTKGAVDEAADLFDEVDIDDNN
jgi:hypothetical protein